ncbi:MAG: hypothetical protein IKI31_03670 [Treponema sp.]|nr:hypothetical protein [Treponema sp.]
MKQQNHWQNNFFTIFSLSLVLIFLSGCSQSVRTITLWTNISECVFYAEFFNRTHNHEKVVLVYKENPEQALEKLNEKAPDLVISSFLKTDRTKQFFKPINSIFNERDISQKSFYPHLLDAGKIKNTIYLLPVNFNLPVLIFSKENRSFVQTDYTLNLSEIKQAGMEFNQKNKQEVLTRIGFIPQHNQEFIYCASKLCKVNFAESKNLFSWNEENLKLFIKSFHDWTLEANSSSTVEQDFSYKYLSMPDYKQVTSGKTLFAYTTSNKFFELPLEQISQLDYRWISNENGIPAEDNIIFAGVPRHAKNTNGSYLFLSWLLNAKTQTQIIEYKEKQMLNTSRFGIAGGFSSLIEINERVLPLHKTALLTNIPQSDAVTENANYPSNWEELKSQIILPYLKEEVSNTEKDEPSNLQTKIEEWEKQHYN